MKTVKNEKTFGGKAARDGKGPLWIFTEENDGSFLVPDSAFISRLYFPLMNEKGMKCFVTPELKGDICRSFQEYLTVATVTEELDRNMSGRNFWIYSEGKKPWSVTGTGVFQKTGKWNEKDESSVAEGKIGSFTLTRGNSNLGLRARTTVFVPVSDDLVEIMIVEIENIADRDVEFIPTSSLPVFGRHADNIRDHRQVTTMFQYTYLHPHGIRVKPTIVHDERGHSVNHTNYIVLGFSEDGGRPAQIWGSLKDFTGEGGSLDNPEAVFKNLDAPEYPDNIIAGREAIAALRFKPVKLQRGRKKSFIMLHGITETETDIERWIGKFGDLKKVKDYLKDTHFYWQKVVNSVSFNTNNHDFNNWVRWVSFQLKCRQIFGNSYLPDFGYGRGGRGWRDLWQDLLSIFLVDPESARQEIINNFGGIRVDGSNATIIGTRPGEFIADRNNVPRTWCDHAAWPVFVLNFYIQQSGDYEILFKELPYWKDQFSHRCKKIDKNWSEKYGFQQKTESGEVYPGSIFEHVLLQQLAAFFHVGEHNNLLLEGADWNDTLDMARERGESVCFYNFYGANLNILADLLEHLRETGLTQISLLTEVAMLLDTPGNQHNIDYGSPREKQAVLQKYFDSVSHSVSGGKTDIPLDELIDDLRMKADHILNHIRDNEWISTKEGYSFFNGHYDNDARRVHGDHELGVRMDLTSQVMPVMFDVATDEQIGEIVRSAKQYLKDHDRPGLRLCTDFRELKLNLGRITGFVYGYKEHGSKWMQQNVMLMYGLYKRGFVREGYEIFRDVFQLCIDSATAKIFPGIPSYLEPGDRGAYAYLTGSSTWLILALTTQMFGVRGEKGNLCLEPKLMAEQFSENGETEIQCAFRNIGLKIRYLNRQKTDWPNYAISGITVNGRQAKFDKSQNLNKAVIDFNILEELCTEPINHIEVILSG